MTSVKVIATKFQVEYVKSLSVRESSLMLHSSYRELDVRHFLFIYHTGWFRKNTTWASKQTQLTPPGFNEPKLQMSCGFMIYELWLSFCQRTHGPRAYSNIWVWREMLIEFWKNERSTVYAYDKIESASPNQCNNIYETVWCVCFDFCPFSSIYFLYGHSKLLIPQLRNTYIKYNKFFMFETTHQWSEGVRPHLGPLSGYISPPGGLQYVSTLWN